MLTIFKCAPLFFLEMEAIFQFQRYKRLVRLLIIHRRLTIILLNDEDVSNIEKILYAFVSAHRVAEIIFEMRKICDVF